MPCLESGPGRSDGRPRKSKLSRMKGAIVGGVCEARTLKGPFQLREIFVLRKVASVPSSTPWQMLKAEL